MALVVAERFIYYPRVDLSQPLSDISPSLHGEVLEFLVRTSIPATGRQVAAGIGRTSHRGTLLVLDQLVSSGLVQRTEAGPAHLYALNDWHLLAAPVREVARTRSLLFDRIARLLDDSETAPVTVAVFGSVARGTATTASDVDLLVLRDRSQDLDALLLELKSWVERWTGNVANIVEYTVQAWQSAEESRESFITDISRDAIVVWGAPLPTAHRQGKR
jgi:predicted nucleotidyltransferase